VKERMKNFTTNIAVKDSLDSTSKTGKIYESEFLSKAIQEKLKLIEKAFR
jgi:hypothetical protein